MANFRKSESDIEKKLRNNSFVHEELSVVLSTFFKNNQTSTYNGKLTRFTDTQYYNERLNKNCTAINYSTTINDGCRFDKIHV